MQQQEFLDRLRADGFAEVTTVQREPGGLDLHTHPFEARALILDGEIALTVDGHTTAYRAGDIFHLAAGVAHSERYGPQGVRYLVGRR